MNPLISVIIPTYNRKDIILESINSVLVQEPKNFEIIVVDDGSTDDTSNFIESFNLPVSVIRKENGGVASARNAGIKASKGEYISFLDSDDLWLPGILKEQVEYLLSHPDIPLVYTDQILSIKGENPGITRFGVTNTTHEQKSKFDLPGFAQSPPIHTSSVMVRKSIFNELGYFNENLKIHEDTDMWNRISEKYNLGYIEKPLAVFRWDKDPEHLLMASKRRLFINEGKKYMKFYEERKQGRLTEREKKAIEESHKRMDLLEDLINDFENGKVTDEEFEERREEISVL